ncbi:hypothetical protein ACMA5I_12795 [Paracoccaceae bacterium GXU_MW_L88]
MSDTPEDGGRPRKRNGFYGPVLIAFIMIWTFFCLVLSMLVKDLFAEGSLWGLSVSALLFFWVVRTAAFAFGRVMRHYKLPLRIKRN